MKGINFRLFVGLPSIHGSSLRFQTTAALLDRLIQLQRSTSDDGISPAKTEAESYQDVKPAEISKEREKELLFGVDARYANSAAVASDDDDENYLKLNLPFRARHHPGRMAGHVFSLPDDLAVGLQRLSRGYDTNLLVSSSETLDRDLLTRRLAPERKEIQQSIQKRVRAMGMELEDQTLTKEQEEKLVKLVKKDIKRDFPWNPRIYDKKFDCASYAVGRFAAEYAAVANVFKEIKKRFPRFRPTHMMDFGTGIGGVVWAANESWPNSLKGHYCVEVSPHMKEMALKLMSVDADIDWRNDDVDFTLTKKKRFNSLHVRSYIPESLDKWYQLATSTFTLLDLPSAEERLKVVERMWLKLLPYGFLVLVENGSKFGFDAIQEARDFIVSSCSLAERKWQRGPRKPDNKGAVAYIKGRHRAYGQCKVVAPCPHNEPCPLYNHIPVNARCVFSVNYKSPITKSSTSPSNKTANYSYVVIQKFPSNLEKNESVARSLKWDQSCRQATISDDLEQNANQLSISVHLGKGDASQSDARSQQSLSTNLVTASPLIRENKQKDAGSIPESDVQMSNDAKSFKSLHEEDLFMSDEDHMRTWPRVLTEPIVKKSNVHTKLCLPDGRLYYKNFSRKKDSREAYFLARFSRWGDLLPIEELENEGVSEAKKGED